MKVVSLETGVPSERYAADGDSNGDFVSDAINLTNDTATFATPSAGQMIFGCQQQAGSKIYPAWEDQFGNIFRAQDLIHDSTYWYAASSNSGTDFTFFNCAFTSSGNAGVSVTYNVGSPVTAKPRRKLSTSIIAGNVAYMITSSAKRLYLSTHDANSAGQPSGFTEIFRFATEGSQSVARCFIGLSTASGAPTNVEPSTLLNCVGLIKRAADTNWQFYAAGSSVGTPIDLGTNFQYSNGVVVEEFELLLHNPKGSANIYWQVTKLTATPVVAKGVVTSNLITNQTFLHTRLWVTNNTALAVASLTVSALAGSRPT
jgi:hypothetical protein